MPPQVVKCVIMENVNFTLSLPINTRSRMQRFEHVKWSNAIRNIIDILLNDFEKAEKLAKVAGLTQKEADELTNLVNVGMAKRSRELLNEINSRR